jgi:ubiquinone/menaquinone biosynthesis C-methylase UbiE
MPQSISFDRVADRYDETRFYPPEVAGQIAEALIAHGHVPEGGVLLEVGIGTGRIALPVLAQGVNVVGVDISPLMVGRLQEKYKVVQAEDTGHHWGQLTIELVDMTALPFADAAFDAAVGVHVFHLVPEWQRALDEVLRMVKPGGAFMLGQDVREDTPHHHIHHTWQELVAALGYTPRRVGAQDAAEVREELRSRGLPVEVLTVATWTIHYTPRMALDSILRREWSLTWHVPDDIFAESARQLAAWAEQQYGDQLDRPLPATCSFQLAVVRKA